MNRFKAQLIAACAGGLGATAAFAHDGHGMSGTHWHATDTLGFVAVAAMIAVAIWLSSRK